MPNSSAKDPARPSSSSTPAKPTRGPPISRKEALATPTEQANQEELEDRKIADWKGLELFFLPADVGDGRIDADDVLQRSGIGEGDDFGVETVTASLLGALQGDDKASCQCGPRACRSARRADYSPS